MQGGQANAEFTGCVSENVMPVRPAPRGQWTVSPRQRSFHDLLLIVSPCICVEIVAAASLLRRMEGPIGLDGEDRGFMDVVAYGALG